MNHPNSTIDLRHEVLSLGVTLLRDRYDNAQKYCCDLSIKLADAETHILILRLIVVALGAALVAVFGWKAH